MIDIERLKRASVNIEVAGLCNSPMRAEKIEEAIKLIQEKPNECLASGYLGVKNYAAFGDQESNCGYGMCPSHGAIVFSIGRTYETRDKNIKMGKDEIYYLMVARDNPQGFRKAAGKKDDPINYVHIRDIGDFINFITQHEIDQKVIKQLTDQLIIEE